MDKRILEIYKDYDNLPYVSSKRDIDTWLKNPKPVPKKNMLSLEDGLFAGDIILLWRINFGTFTTESTFPKYFEYTYGIDAQKNLEGLVKKEYAVVESAFNSLDHINSTQKKSILKEKGIKGLSKMKAADLDVALFENFSEEELADKFAVRGYKLTKKGEDTLEKYEDVVARHPKKNI